MQRLDKLLGSPHAAAEPAATVAPAISATSQTNDFVSEMRAVSAPNVRGAQCERVCNSLIRCVLPEYHRFRQRNQQRQRQLEIDRRQVEFPQVLAFHALVGNMQQSFERGQMRAATMRRLFVYALVLGLLFKFVWYFARER